MDARVVVHRCVHGRSNRSYRLDCMAMKNPPAFPGPDTDKHPQGMTLRDYFAAKAMQAYISEPSAIKAINKHWPDEIPKRVSIAAYRFADAMLKVRES